MFKSKKKAKAEAKAERQKGRKAERQKGRKAEKAKEAEVKKESLSLSELTLNAKLIKKACEACIFKD